MFSAAVLGLCWLGRLSRRPAPVSWRPVISIDLRLEIRLGRPYAESGTPGRANLCHKGGRGDGDLRVGRSLLQPRAAPQRPRLQKPCGIRRPITINREGHSQKFPLNRYILMPWDRTCRSKLCCFAAEVDRPASQRTFCCRLQGSVTAADKCAPGCNLGTRAETEASTFVARSDHPCLHRLASGCLYSAFNHSVWKNSPAGLSTRSYVCAPK